LCKGEWIVNRHFLLPGLVVAVVLAISSAGLAQSEEAADSAKEMKPVLTLSFAGFNAVRNDMRLLAEASGDAQLMFTLMLMGNQGLPGLDVDRPWGVVVQTDGREYPAYAFVPVTDLAGMIQRVADFERLFDALQQSGGLKLPGAAEPEPELDEAPKFGQAPKTDEAPESDEAAPKPDAPDEPPPEPESLISGPDEDGVYQIAAPGGAFYLQEKDGWAFFAGSRQTLAGVPADPETLLEGLNESYTLGVRVTFPNLPQGVRERILQRVRDEADRRGSRGPDELVWQYILRNLLSPRSAEDVAKWLEEAATVQAGIGVDPESKSMRLDGKITAIEETATAAELALLGESTSNLAGLFMAEGDAVLTALTAGLTSERHSTRVQELIESYASRAAEDLDRQELSDADRELAKQGLDDLIEVIKETVQRRQLDAGMVVLADDDQLGFVVASGVADTAKLEELFKGAVDLAARTEPRFAEVVTLDAETHQGVRLHTISVPADEIPHGDRLPPGLVGETLSAAVAFGEKNAYLAVGPKAIETLKKVIEQSQAAAGESVPPFRVSLSAAALGRLVASTAPEDELGFESSPASKILDALQRAGDNDHVTIAAEAVDGGVRAELEMEHGVFRAAQAVVMAVIRQFMAGERGTLLKQGILPGRPGF